MASGTNLPTSDAIISVGGSKCTATGTSTQLSCTLTIPVPAGEHDVQVITANGIVPSTAATKVTVDLTVSAVAVNGAATKLNPAGLVSIGITGTGFDQTNLANNKVTLEDGTTCRVYYVDSTNLYCTFDDKLTDGSISP